MRRRTVIATVVAAVGIVVLAPGAVADPPLDGTSDDVLCIAHRAAQVGVCVDDSPIVAVRRLLKDPPP